MLPESPASDGQTAPARGRAGEEPQPSDRGAAQARSRLPADQHPAYNRPVDRVPTRFPIAALIISIAGAIGAVVVLGNDGGYILAAVIAGVGIVGALEIGHWLQQRKRLRVHGQSDEPDVAPHQREQRSHPNPPPTFYEEEGDDET